MCWASNYFIGTKVYDWRNYAVKNINFLSPKLPPMRLLFFIATITLLSCGENSSSKKKETPTEDTAKKATDTIKAVPAVKEEPPTYVSPDEGLVNDALKAKYGNRWHVLNDKEAKWIKDAFDYFIVSKRKENPNYPYISKGDYNADGKPDMAAVVTDSTKSSYQIAILLGGDNIQFWEEDIMIDAALSTIPKSTIEGIDGEKTKKIKMKGDGINVEYFEKASFVVYWDKASFKRIQTGD
jgi:hypothetical protein